MLFTVHTCVYSACLCCSGVPQLLYVESEEVVKTIKKSNNITSTPGRYIIWGEESTVVCYPYVLDAADVLNPL